VAQGMTADNLHISQDFIKTVLSGHALADVSALGPPPFYILLKSLVLGWGFSLRLGVVGGLVYPVLPAVLVIFLCVAAISPYLNRSVGKIGVNRLLFTAVLPKRV